MANGLYDFGRESFLGGDIAYDTDNIKCMIIDDSDDPPNLATDQFLADRLAAARVATSGNFATKTITAGVADAADIVLSSVTGDISDSIDIFQDTAVEATSILICNIDTATGLPVTPNGTDITITWDNGANKIFKL